MRGMLSGAIVLSMALLLSAPAVWTVETMAQTKDKSTQAPMAEKQIEGKIQKVAGNKVTLTDGTELTIPASVKVQQKDLKPGATVKASYEEKGGQKVVTNLQVQP
jgi:hypothetical protein